MTPAAAQTAVLPIEVRFRPRRLGHVNLWVDDLERSVAFYESVCGLELVRRERELLIAFHSNGNTHHDLGIIEVSRGRDRYGRDGMLQIPKTRGLSPGLNHLGWEMETEAELVAAYRRALELGYPVQRTVDHLISHSVYLSDPDGNGHEFYADQMNDWRRIYNLEVEDEVTGAWDPLAGEPSHEPHYNLQPPIQRVERARLHPSHLSGVRFTTRRFDEMVAFFTRIAGLDAVQRAQGSVREVRLAGATGRVDLRLAEAAPDEPTGLRTFRLQLAEPTDLAAAAASLRAAGVEASVACGEPDELIVRDPDGFAIEFHHAPAPAQTGARSTVVQAG
jgi:catechol 2,3-dioxygenase